MTLRVNCRQTTRDAYLERLAEAGMAAEANPVAPQGINLEKPVEVEALPGFAQGMVSVQDGAAQLAAQLIELEPGQAVLDACAAPGGKTGHLLESCPDISLTAIDLDGERLARVKENLSRLQLQASLFQGVV